LRAQKALKTKKAFATGALPQTPLEKLTALTSRIWGKNKKRKNRAKEVGQEIKPRQ